MKHRTWAENLYKANERMNRYDPNGWLDDSSRLGDLTTLALKRVEDPEALGWGVPGRDDGTIGYRESLRYRESIRYRT